ncbi:hypothetical protein D3C75_1187770 [compost metagenome]
MQRLLFMTWLVDLRRAASWRLGSGDRGLLCELTALQLWTNQLAPQDPGHQQHQQIAAGVEQLIDKRL